MFKILDKDHSGILTGIEIKQFVQDMYGRRFAVVSVAQKVVKEVSDKLNLDLPAFIDFMRRHGELAMPVFQLQDLLRNKIVGEKFWTQQIKERQRMDPEIVDAMLARAQNIMRSKEKSKKSFSEPAVAKVQPSHPTVKGNLPFIADDIVKLWAQYCRG
jgi:hypothetical protein